MKQNMIKNINDRLKNNPCNNCGGNSGVVIVQGNDLLEDLPGTFQFIRCDACGVLRQEPRLDWVDLNNYYQPGYVCHSPQFSATKKTLKEHTRALGPKKRVNIVNKYKQNGKWLDVGCGSGLILQAAKESRQWSLFGVEPVKEMAEYTSAHLNVPVFAGTFEEYQGKESDYDIVSMWDVIEHLSKPFDAIKEVSKLLKTGGVFVFSTPNLNSIDRKIFKETWLGYDLPRHLYLFPDSLLRQVLKSQGLEVLDRFCFTGSHGSLYLNLAYWNKHHQSRILEWLLTKGSEWFPFRLLTFLPLRIIDWLKLGTSITYIARKV
jgi:2-polyprenyl-3-methyl-5-hydroxy-6-metoxy-1,4-benzoquinol methylase